MFEEPLPMTSKRPAVPIKRSITNDYLVCLEDGAHVKRLRPYLRKKFGMSPDEYRAKWGLPPEYPMTAPYLSALLSASTRARNAAAHDEHQQSSN